MTIRGLAALVTTSLALLLAGCGGGSGRSGTDLTVSGVGPTIELNGGDAVLFTMTVANVGDYDAPNVVIKNTTLQVSQASLTINCTPSAGATCPTATGPSMTVPSLPKGGSLVFEISGTANTGASGIISNTMSVTSDIADIDADNNVATVSTSAFSNDVSVTATPPAGPLVDGPATFLMVVANAGPDDAQDVVLTTTVSANLTLAPSAISCVPSGGATAPTLQTNGTLLASTLPVNGVLTCNVPVTVVAATSGFAVVTTTAATTGDSRSSNNSGTASVSATLVNDIGVTATAASTSVVGGKSTTFAVQVSNAGPSTAFDVVLSNVLSPNLTLSGAITCSASGGALVPTAGTDGTLVSASIPSGGGLSCTVPVTVAAGAIGTAGITFSAAAAGDQKPSNNSVTASFTAVSSNLGVSQTVAGPVAAGTSTTFVALVNNPGPGAASNLNITWTHSSASGVTFDAPTCTASGGATCPATLGPTMTLASLGIGRTLTFTFKVNVAASFRGNIVNTLAVTSTEDQDLTNNSASTTVVAVDGRSGAYSVFAADGRAYNLSIDFDAGKYTMSGNAQSVDRTFTLNSATGDYEVSGNARLRVAADLLVGGHDFGAGVQPFIAARIFATSVASIAGTYNLATLNVPASGNAVTHAGTARVSGNVMQLCQSDLSVSAAQNCDAGALKSFVLSVSADVFTGIESTTGEVYSFRVARSAASSILLSAGTAPDTSQQLRIGLPDSAGLAGGTLRGPSATGDWVTLTLGSTSYAVSGSSSNDSATLQNIGVAGPFSMLTGTLATNGARIYVLQASPLAVAVGGFGGSPSASGLLQLALP